MTNRRSPELSNYPTVLSGFAAKGSRRYERYDTPMHAREEQISDEEPMKMELDALTDALFHRLVVTFLTFSRKNARNYPRRVPRVRHSRSSLQHLRAKGNATGANNPLSPLTLNSRLISLDPLL